eukprot:1728454-Amphidinium_carterae.1
MDIRLHSITPLVTTPCLKLRSIPSHRLAKEHVERSLPGRCQAHMFLAIFCAAFYRRGPISKAVRRKTSRFSHSARSQSVRAWEDVKQWALDEGATGLDTVSLQYSGEAGLGICAEQDFQQGDTIVGVPLHACLRTHPDAANSVPPRDVW